MEILWDNIIVISQQNSVVSKKKVASIKKTRKIILKIKVESFMIHPVYLNKYLPQLFQIVLQRSTSKANATKRR